MAVVGSFVMDLVVHAPRRPEVGETLLGTSFAMYLGGKGINQAVAAARLGATVHMIGRVGNDQFGKSFLRAMEEEGVNGQFVIIDQEEGTGIGTPVIDEKGNNSIILIPRANTKVTVQDVEKARVAIEEADVLTVQLELPVEASHAAARIAKDAGRTVVLNCAPYRPIGDDFLRLVDYLVPNEVEAEQLFGIGKEDLLDAAKARSLVKKTGCKVIVVTVGEEGSILIDAKGVRQIPAPLVQAVDSVGAGDAFVGAFCVAVGSGMDTAKAVELANAAGALSVTRHGAMPSMPRRDELIDFLMRTRKIKDRTWE
ncbi:ribokinase [Candidatus Hakubella thermalkaliphila]|uniref:Ribokinase n=1 Tax=Candidatus Hakubella thermalkaliphila TaxID=2754717 RepID=A0A6V8P5U0_9ACTN|nr:ribokinase [Candidatus Hakubella thermalkaliphila]GFP27985.1 ribokinase [Candidatus Hakubella thermalkaliphila]GFP42533.1 ribokinase [Candidatus Hakubella thermalkaliphila]